MCGLDTGGLDFECVFYGAVQSQWRRKCATLVGQCAISPFISTSPSALSSRCLQLPSDSPPVYPFIHPLLTSPSHYAADLSCAKRPRGAFGVCYFGYLDGTTLD